MRDRRKTGRRASLEERHLAQNIVDNYRRALSNGGSFVVNPDAPRDEQTTYHADEEALLWRLEEFAKHGTFEIVNVRFEPLFMNAQRRKLKEKRTKGEIAQAVADEEGVSLRTAYRRLKEGLHS